MPDVTITFLDGTVSVEISEADMVLLSALIPSPQVFVENVADEMRTRLGQEVRNALGQKAVQVNAAYAAADAKDRQELDAKATEILAKQRQEDQKQAQEAQAAEGEAKG